MVQKQKLSRFVASERAIIVAKREFAALGFAAVRMGKIAIDSGCSLETIYDVYGRKEDLYRACMSRALEFANASIDDFTKNVAKLPLTSTAYVIGLSLSYLCPESCTEYSRLLLNHSHNEDKGEFGRAFSDQRAKVSREMMPFFDAANREGRLQGANPIAALDAFIDLATFRVGAAWAYGDGSRESIARRSYENIIAQTLMAFVGRDLDLSQTGVPNSVVTPSDRKATSAVSDWLFDEMAIGAWEWSVSEQFLRCSQTWLSLNGLPVNNSLVPFEFIERTRHQADLEVAKAALRAHLNGEAEFYMAEFRITTLAGERKWFSDKGRVVTRDEAGKPLRMVGIISEISELRR